MIELVRYEPSAECCNCEKTTECVVIKTEAFTKPHCAKCVMKEAKKRHGGNGKVSESPLFKGGES